MLEFSSDTEMQKIVPLTQELFEKVLYDEEPLFISDEATLWDVSMSDVEEILQRLRKYYKVPLTFEDTKQPLWKLLPELDGKRGRTDPAL